MASTGFIQILEARLTAQHVFGGSAEEIQRTLLLRRRVYDLLEKTVVDLFVRRQKTRGAALWPRPRIPRPCHLGPEPHH